ncbi:MAG: hypothetical protein Q4B68_00475, partial [Bacteroidales bacterium]|nr:hypothetical protein [Bacteroidales bacterium]
IQDITINIASCLSGLKQFDNAISILNTIKDANNLPAPYYVNLSYAYLMKDNNKAVKEVCCEGLKKYPKDQDILGNLLLALSNLGAYEEAYSMAVERLKYNRNIHTICEVANVLYKIAETNKNKDFPKAIESYKGALTLYKEAEQLNPRYQAASYNIALILFKMKRFQDSQNQISKIQQLEGGMNVVLVTYTAKNLLWTSDFQRGLEFCDKWLKHWPDSINLQRVRAEILVDGYVLGKVNKDGYRIIERSSLDFFTNIVKDGEACLPSDIVYLSKIHFWMEDQEKINYALNLLQKSMTKFPDYWQFDYYIAQAYLHCGYKKQALHFAQESNRKAPWRETTYKLLAKVYKETYQSDTDSNYVKYCKLFEEYNSRKIALYDSCKTV